MKFCRLIRQVTDCLGKKIMLYASGICVRVLKAQDSSWKTCEDLLPCVHNITFQLVRLSPHLTGKLPGKDEFKSKAQLSCAAFQG